MNDENKITIEEYQRRVEQSDEEITRATGWKGEIMTNFIWHGNTIEHAADDKLGDLMPVNQWSIFESVQIVTVVQCWPWDRSTADWTARYIITDPLPRDATVEDGLRALDELYTATVPEHRRRYYVEGIDAQQPGLLRVEWGT